MTNFQFQATEYGAPCVQFMEFHKHDRYAGINMKQESEDCLFLNIFSPYVTQFFMNNYICGNQQELSRTQRMKANYSRFWYGSTVVRFWQDLVTQVRWKYISLKNEINNDILNDELC